MLSLDNFYYGTAGMLFLHVHVCTCNRYIWIPVDHVVKKFVTYHKVKVQTYSSLILQENVAAGLFFKKKSIFMMTQFIYLILPSKLYEFSAFSMISDVCQILKNGCSIYCNLKGM
jgi:hypothetical protein